MRMGAGPVRKATTGIMESWRARVHTVFSVLLTSRFFELALQARAVRKYYIGKYKDKSTAFVASPPSAGLFLGVQQNPFLCDLRKSVYGKGFCKRPRVGVFTHQRVTLAGLSTVRASTVFIY